MTRLNVVIAAEEAAGAQTVKTVARSDHRIVAVLTGGEQTSGMPSPVFGATSRLDLPRWPAEWVRDPALADRLRDEQVDLLMNVHSLYIIAAPVLAAPRIGAFNLHPGPLPEYAGLNTPSWAVYHGRKRYGVTLHWMVPKIDAGPIAYRADFDISDEDTALTVATNCVRHGLPLLDELLEAAERGRDAIPRIQQDLKRRRYYGRQVPNQGWLDWSRPAREIADFVRACDYGPFPAPWPWPRTRLGDVEVRVAKVALTEEPSSAVPGCVEQVERGSPLVATGTTLIEVKRVEADGVLVDAGTLLRLGSQLAMRGAVQAGTEPKSE